MATGPGKYDDQQSLAGIVDHETDAERVFKRAIGAFVEVLVQELTAEQAMALANTSREHGGVLVFTEGGLALGIAVEFSDLLSTDEARAAELNAQRQDGRQVFVRKGRVVS